MIFPIAVGLAVYRRFPASNPPVLTGMAVMTSSLWAGVSLSLLLVVLMRYQTPQYKIWFVVWFALSAFSGVVAWIFVLSLLAFATQGC